MLRERVRGALSARARVRLSSGETRALGRLNVYRQRARVLVRPGPVRQPARLRRDADRRPLGVANKSLPCGTKVTLRHSGRVVRVPVIDRGPYVGGREYDLTAATAASSASAATAPIQVTR